ncbi:MAG: hypothetical protein ACI4ST_05445 [Candidatus Gallimonas sp.]
MKAHRFYGALFSCGAPGKRQKFDEKIFFQSLDFCVQSVYNGICRKSEFFIPIPEKAGIYGQNHAVERKKSGD